MRVLLAILILFISCNSLLAQSDSLRDQATAAVAAGEIDTAIEKFNELLALTPDDGAAHYRVGILLMDNNGKLADAVPHFERAGELGFQPLGVAYRLARIHARQGHDSKSLKQLEILAKGGFGLINLIDDEPDFNPIRNKPRFVAATEIIRATRFPCDTDERHHSFDFWIGHWDVTQNGQFAGTNSIQPILGHCLIFEQWESASGGLGKSFNYYDPGHGHWRQIWISDSGTIIEFTGEARDGGIFYAAETIDPASRDVTHHKFEFTQIDDGQVRQFWQTSTDGGKTWSTIWDGRYKRKSSSD